MKCLNCGKNVPDDAKRCQRCEADMSAAKEVGEFQESDMAAAVEAINKVMPDGIEALRDLAESCHTGEEFANAIMIGCCPECDSEDVGSFEEVVGINNPLTARCFSCGFTWCTSCGQPVSNPKKCAHEAVCDKCGKDEDCPYYFDLFVLAQMIGRPT